MISVALCTCNGEDFLPAQLNSLLAQRRLPDELIVCDDASDDATFAILEAFALRAPFVVKLYRNNKRMGIGGNFNQAIDLCSGEIIAVCDQDDVWMPEKLACFTRAFASGADWVCCDAKVVDAMLCPLGYSLWERMDFNSKEKKLAQQGRCFEILLKHFVVAGATLAFRAELRKALSPIPDDWQYDAWLSTMLAATARGALVDASLQCYRQHRRNAVGGTRRSLPSDIRAAFSLDRNAHYQQELSRWSKLAGRLRGVASSDVENSLAEKIAHIRRRAGLPANRLARLPTVAAETSRGGYYRYARNWGSIALDLLVK